jgi:PAS domain S-box-containing protein
MSSKEQQLEQILAENEELRRKLAVYEAAYNERRPVVVVEQNNDEKTFEADISKALFDRIEQLIYFIELRDDGTRNIKYIGSQLTKILGLTQEEYFADPTATIKNTHPEDLPGLYETARRLREEKTAQTFIYRYFHKIIGDYVWLEETIYPEFSVSGVLVSNMGFIRDVSNRMEAERGLRESQDVMSQILDNIDEVVYHIDVTKPLGQRVRYVGDNIETVFGISRNEFIHGPYSFLEDCHPDDVPHIRKMTEDLFREKRMKTYIYRFLHRQRKEYIWIEERVIPRYDQFGKHIATFGVSHDITERIQSENVIRESEERFRMLAENASDVIYRYKFSPEPHYEYVSPAIEKMTGYTPEEFYADGFLGFKILHPEDAPLMENSEATIRNKKEGRISEAAAGLVLRWVKKNGEIIWTETRNKPEYDEEGKLVAVEGISRDVTKNKIFEMEILSSRENYRQLTEKAPDGIIIIGFDGKAMYSNPAANKLFEITEEAQLTIDILAKFYNFNKTKAFQKRLEEISFEEELVAFPVTKTIKENGVEAEYESRPIRYAYHGIPAILIFIRDVTVIRDLEKEQMRASFAEEANRILQEEINQRILTQQKLEDTRKYLQLIIDSSLDIICASDNLSRITEFNLAAEEAFGYKREEVLGKDISILFNDQDERKRLEKELINQGETFVGNIVNRRKDETMFTAFLSASALKNEQGEIIGTMGISRDISDIMRAEQEIRLSETKYRAIFNQAYIGISLVDTVDGRNLEVNQRLCEMLGYAREELCQITVDQLRVPGDLSRLPKGQEFIRGGFERIIDEQRYKRKDGTEIFVNLTITLVKDEQHQPLHFVYVYEDLTPKRNAEEQIRLQAAKLNSIIENSNHMIWNVNRKHELTIFNRNHAVWLKRAYNVIPYIGMNMFSDEMISTDKYNKWWLEKIRMSFEGKPQQFETSFTEKNGHTTWSEVYINPIFNEQGKAIEVSCIAHDVTEKKETEEQVRQSLKEKEVLLKEVHHRVKNNLQVISSILNLQSAYVRDENTLEILLESQNRIKSMAFVHESLYQTKDFSNISFSEYVENIARNLIQSYGSIEVPPSLKMELDDISLHLDTAIPCGLIINEIISNALKYAFPDKRQGVIDVSVKEKNKKITISIADNGVGIPAHIDYRNTDSLGLQLVVTLVEQINGILQVENKKGTKFTVEFTHT